MRDHWRKRKKPPDLGNPSRRRPRPRHCYRPRRELASSHPDHSCASPPCHDCLWLLSITLLLVVLDSVVPPSKPSHGRRLIACKSAASSLSRPHTAHPRPTRLEGSCLYSRYGRNRWSEGPPPPWPSGSFCTLLRRSGLLWRRLRLSWVSSLMSMFVSSTLRWDGRIDIIAHFIDADCCFVSSMVIHLCCNFHDELCILVSGLLGSLLFRAKLLLNRRIIKTSSGPVLSNSLVYCSEGDIWILGSTIFCSDITLRLLGITNFWICSVGVLLGNHIRIFSFVGRCKNTNNKKKDRFFKRNLRSIREVSLRETWSSKRTRIAFLNAKRIVINLTLCLRELRKVGSYGYLLSRYSRCSLGLMASLIPVIQFERRMSGKIVGLSHVVASVLSQVGSFSLFPPFHPSSSSFLHVIDCNMQGLSLEIWLSFFIELTWCLFIQMIIILHKMFKKLKAYHKCVLFNFSRLCSDYPKIFGFSVHCTISNVWLMYLVSFSLSFYFELMLKVKERGVPLGSIFGIRGSKQQVKWNLVTCHVMEATEPRCKLFLLGLLLFFTCFLRRNLIHWHKFSCLYPNLSTKVRFFSTNVALLPLSLSLHSGIYTSVNYLSSASLVFDSLSTSVSLVFNSLSYHLGCLQPRLAEWPTGLGHFSEHFSKCELLSLCLNMMHHGSDFVRLCIWNTLNMDCVVSWNTVVHFCCLFRWDYYLKWITNSFLSIFSLRYILGGFPSQNADWEFTPLENWMTIGKWITWLFFLIRNDRCFSSSRCTKHGTLYSVGVNLLWPSFNMINRKWSHKGFFSCFLVCTNWNATFYYLVSLIWCNFWLVEFGLVIKFTYYQNSVIGAKPRTSDTKRFWI